MTTSTFKPAMPAQPAAPPARAKRAGRRPGTVAFLMLVPAGVLILTFLLVPIVLTFGLAFTNARLISPQPARFIGFDNFVRLFDSDTFYASLRNTLVFAIVIEACFHAVCQLRSTRPVDGFHVNWARFGVRVIDR